MNFIKRYQTILIALVLIIAAYVVYSYFFATPEEAALTTTDVSGEENAPDRDLIALLLTLHSIRLNDAIFSTPEFQSLTDFSQDLVVEPIGRNNPFAPLGAQGGVQATTPPH